MFSFLFKKKDDINIDDSIKTDLLDNTTDLQSLYLNVLDKKIEYLDDLSFYKLNDKYLCKFKIIFIYTHKNNKTEILDLNADYYEYNDKFYIHKPYLNFKPKHKKGKIDLSLEIYFNNRLFTKYEVRFSFRINNHSINLLENICIDNSDDKTKIIFTLEKDAHNEYYFSELKYISY